MVGSGVGGPGGMEFRKAINGKFTNNPCRLRNCFNFSQIRPYRCAACDNRFYSREAAVQRIAPRAV
jgi:hypothetical protein